MATDIIAKLRTAKLYALYWFAWAQRNSGKVAIALAVALVLVASCAVAADKNTNMIARQGLDYVRLTQASCGGTLANWYAGDAVLKGKPYKMCWRMLPDKRVALVFEDGDMLAVPMQAFKPEGQVDA